MIKLSGKVDKPNTDNRFNISFFIGNRTLFPIKNGILNLLSVFGLFTFPFILITHTHTYIYIYTHWDENY